jgi:DNA polymerase-1
MGVGSPTQEIAPALDCESAEQWRSLVAGLGPTISIGAVLGNDAIGVSVVTAPVAAEQSEEGAPVPTLFADFRRDGLRDAVVETVRSWVGDDAVTLVGHDLKEVLRICGRDAATRCKLIDTMLMAYLVRTSVRNFSLEDVCLELLHHKVVSAKEAGFSKGEPPQQLETAFFVYAAEQSALPLALSDLLSPRLEDGSVERGGDDPGDPARVYHQIEEPLVPVLMRMEEAGVELDVPFLEEMSGRLGTRLQELEAEIYEIADEEFNILSPMQLGKIMFEKLEYPMMKRTRKTKNYSTNAETLEALAAEGYDLAERVLRFREISKLKSTYVDALPELVDDFGRLHTRFNQAVAATGRLSSANPNLQNIPVRTDIGLEIRKAFRAREGQLLLVADYSQIELRVLAHIAEEPELIRAFSEGADIHRSTAASVFEVNPDFVNDEQRRAAKVINFGIIYGMSPFGLAQNLGISNAEAKKFIEAYFERFPEVKRYTDETLERASEELCVTTLFGRTRWLPDIKSRNYPMRENAKRMAINARIQGTAADLMKIAMIEVDERLRQDFPDARLLLTVHDELVLEVPDSGIEAAQAMVVEEMRGAADLKVPLEVDVGVGKTWFDAKHGR